MASAGLEIRHYGISSYERGGSRHFAGREAMPGSPYTIIVETPVALTRARALSFLQRTGMIGLVLLVAGTFLTWVISRRMRARLASCTTLRSHCCSRVRSAGAGQPQG